ncbi:TonB-dependent receptor domain-containing protein [Belliella kenyensis]|uniref:TonB-dependent receptor domain-containing protein n=1 Tax=Belliella kenyensis TaxID=1472724 RepID=A0ABV8EPC3_9BACT|nr:TonB-dependent receptor [Belliella kenyensis]MCH7401608.1 TonB-dependent receptor [Belliella kenyensis]MDN3603113.1 TonB-dependent receptor [Belliella kenyensis]
MKKILTILFLIVINGFAFAQNEQSQVEFFKDLVYRYESKTGIRVLFHTNDLSGLNKISYSDNSDDILDKIIANTQFSYFIIGNKYAVIYPKRLREDYQKRRTNGTKSKSGQAHKVTGIIRDNESKTLLPGALITIPELELGEQADEKGEFSATLPEGTYIAYFSSLGKETDRKIIRVYQDLKLDVTLFESTSELEMVTVTDRAIDYNVKSTSMGLNRVSIEELKLLPPLLGEVDVMKGMLMLPGVTTVGEGASGFNVRGGGVDQNLILMDGVPVFNPSHMFGFFSIFNQDAIKEADLFKGDIPAKYGGRLSSVLDVKTKSGNPKKWVGEGGIGLLSSRLGINGPISKNTQIMTTGRYAYPDWIMHRIPNAQLKVSSTYFYDVNFRIDHQLNDKNGLSLSLYKSQDYFRFGSDTAYTWQSDLASLKWNSIWGENLASDLTLGYSGYKYSVLGEIPPLDFELLSDIQYLGLHHDFEWFGEKFEGFEFGYQVNQYLMGMGELNPISQNSLVIPRSIQSERAIESGIFAQYPIKINNELEAQLGLRYSGFFALGQRDVYKYEEGAAREIERIQDTISYRKGEVYQRYSGWEPRVALRYNVGENGSLKASINRSIQYLHLLSNNFASAPVDLWKLSDNYVKPQESWQYALGAYRNFDHDRIETSFEVYYKDFQSLLEYRDGAQLILNPALETSLVMGRGHAYGGELLVKKKSGKLNGWVSYAFSRTMRIIESEFEEEVVNQGNYFPANWDQPHDLNVLLNYKPLRRVSFSATFNYRTGRPITLPSSIYNIDGSIVVDYQERNQARIPDYHRLDLGVTFDGNQKRESHYKSNITIAFYNVYARRNPFSWFFQPDMAGSVPRSYRLAVIGTIIPSITYNFTFR